MITLTLKDQPNVPLEAECLCPDVLAPLTPEQVADQPIFLGKRQLRLADFFQVEGTGGDELTLRGDLAKVKWIGRDMTRGRIDVQGNVGMHLGAFMRGGRIDVTGNASDWIGAEMTGGLIHVRGNAGGQAGAAYRGSMGGMRGGTILIEGSAGLEVGMRMKRGVIAIRGPVRDFTGLQMKGGTIFLVGGAELRTGAWMIRGTIVTFQPVPLLPTFAPACVYQPTFLTMYARQLAAWGFPLPPGSNNGFYQRYLGDAAVPGKGEMLVWQGQS